MPDDCGVFLLLPFLKSNGLENPQDHDLLNRNILKALMKCLLFGATSIAAKEIPIFKSDFNNVNFAGATQVMKNVPIEPHNHGKYGELLVYLHFEL